MAPVVADDLGPERARPRRHHDRLGILGEDVVDPGLGAKPHVDPELRELALEEEDDLLEVVARRGPHHEVHLTAEARSALEQHDLVPALGRDARRLHPRRPAAGYHPPSGAPRPAAAPPTLPSRPVTGL